jgi:radical SAM protein with 4Fe4S-binding SPASM domain
MANLDRFSELRVLRWFDRIDSILEGDFHGPIRANLDLTNVCTHHCGFCEPLAYREETLLDHRGTLKTEVALEVLEELAAIGCKTINFSGGGEPTLHPCFGPILKRAVDLGMKTWIVTHGGQMHKWFDHLLLADHVRVSLDASLPEEHAAMHGTNWREFEKVKENIRELCKRRVSETPEVGIAYIVADCNSSASSLRGLLDFASDVGADFVHFRPLSEETHQRLTEAWPIIAMRIKETAVKYTVNIFLGDKRLTDVFQQRDFESCYSALTMAVIGANGDVQACCDRRDIIFGNVNQQSFKSIWLSAKHREKADAIVPKLCQRCLQCGYNRAVEKYIVENSALPELL